MEQPTSGCFIQARRRRSGHSPSRQHADQRSTRRSGPGASSTSKNSDDTVSVYALDATGPLYYLTVPSDQYNLGLAVDGADNVYLAYERTASQSYVGEFEGATRRGIRSIPRAGRRRRPRQLGRTRDCVGSVASVVTLTPAPGGKEPGRRAAPPQSLLPCNHFVIASRYVRGREHPGTVASLGDACGPEPKRSEESIGCTSSA
jgi:hypothetical protein